MAVSRSFTVKAQGGVLRQLVTECSACAAFDPDTLPQHLHPQFKKFKALWDTGATGSVITQAVVDACGLKPIGIAMMRHAQGVTQSEKFLVNIGLPNAVAFRNVTVIRGDLSDADMLIGMDIITSGDFSLTNKSGITLFSFRVPSMATIDYVKESLAQAAAPKYVHAKHGNKKKKRR